MGKSCVCFSTAGLLTWDLGRSRGRSPQGQQGQPGHLGIGLTALGPGSGVPTAVCGLRAPVRAGLAVSEGSSQSLELWVGCGWAPCCRNPPGAVPGSGAGLCAS